MTIATKTPINSIKIPRDYIDLCTAWHGGIDCKLYAVCSTKGLTTGTHCPTNCDDDPEKWYLHIWRELSADLAYTVRVAQKGTNIEEDGSGSDGQGHDADYPALVQFEDWTDCIVERLEREYGLEDWEG